MQFLCNCPNISDYMNLYIYILLLQKFLKNLVKYELNAMQHPDNS